MILPNKRISLVDTFYPHEGHGCAVVIVAASVVVVASTVVGMSSVVIIAIDVIVVIIDVVVEVHAVVAIVVGSPNAVVAVVEHVLLEGRISWSFY